MTTMDWLVVIGGLAAIMDQLVFVSIATPWAAG
jgi:hypothetical protein